MFICGIFMDSEYHQDTIKEISLSNDLYAYSLGKKTFLYTTIDYKKETAQLTC